MTVSTGVHIPRIAAHRGGMGEATASSVEAFRRAAVDLHVDLELDVHPTSDGQLVVFHDDRLDATTNMVGYIHDYPLDVLRAELDLSNGVAPERVGIATLEEVFAVSGAAQVSIDIKEDIGKDSWVEARVGRCLEEYAMTERAIVASFLDPPLRRFRLLYSRIATAASSAESIRWYQDFHNQDVSSSPYQVLSLPLTLMGSEYLTTQLVDWAHSQGLAVWVWTVNEPEDLRRVQQMGFDVVVTDYPTRALEVYIG
jgi:glycerophosphoryl diester phosphodiesterase